MKMKNVRAKKLAKDLKGVVDLPDYPDNQLVEITVLPTTEEKNFTVEERKAALRKIDEIMVPVLKSSDFNPHKTLDEYRMERLEAKYRNFN